MKKITKTLLATLIAIFAMTFTNSVNANYQIVYQPTLENYSMVSANDFITNVRNMEANGQVMGLNENINTDLTPITSNNIDVHLQKNTEYGAMILFSASTKYGKQPDANDTTPLKESRFVKKGTTTGNVSGVDMNESNWNIIAADIGTGNSAYSTSINDKYINRYSDTNKRFYGDALLTWHNTKTTLLDVGYIITRYDSNSVFGYCYGFSYRPYNDVGYGFARAVVVCGEGV